MASGLRRVVALFVAIWAANVCALPSAPGTASAQVVKPPVPEGCTAPVDRVGPRAPPPFPPIAKLMGWEGSTDLRFTVEADGRVRPEGISIARSSGHPVLDGAAVTFIMEYRFGPATCLGVPKAADHIYRVTFRLDEWSPHCTSPRLADGEATRAAWPVDVPKNSLARPWVDVAFMVTTEGRAEPAQMMIMTPSGNRELDLAALAFIMARRFEPMRCNGSPVFGQLGYRVRFETQP